MTLGITCSFLCSSVTFQVYKCIRVLLRDHLLDDIIPPTAYPPHTLMAAGDLRVEDHGDPAGTWYVPLLPELRCCELCLLVFLFVGLWCRFPLVLVYSIS